MFNTTQSLSFEGVQRFSDFAGNIVVAEFYIFLHLFDAHHERFFGNLFVELRMVELRQLNLLLLQLIRSLEVGVDPEQLFGISSEGCFFLH